MEKGVFNGQEVNSVHDLIKVSQDENANLKLKPIIVNKRYSIPKENIAILTCLLSDAKEFFKKELNRKVEDSEIIVECL